MILTPMHPFHFPLQPYLAFLRIYKENKTDLFVQGGQKKAGMNNMVEVFPTFTALEIPSASVDEQVKNLLSEYKERWWQSDLRLPTFRRTYTPAEQSVHEKELARLTDGLMYGARRLPRASQSQRLEFQQTVRDQGFAFLSHTLELSEEDIHFLQASGLLEGVQGFAQRARRFDPSISGDDIYQAARNVMSMNFLQLLFGLPVEVTPAVFAYSMLYPYSDNYLDDLTVSSADKRSFNLRFKQRLEGETIRCLNVKEERINELVSMIESQYERSRFPQVWQSLLAIFNAQARSIQLVKPGLSPYEADILGITLEKGGASVLADGYLVAGWLNAAEAKFCFGYGAFTQCLDDLEDIHSDLKEGRMTLFTQTAPHWRLDALTNRIFHFGHTVFNQVNGFPTGSSASLYPLIEHILDPMLLDTLGRAAKFYSRDYLRAAERSLPFRFDILKKQRARLEGQKMTLGRITDLWTGVE